MLSYLLPTRNRPERLAATLRAVGNLSAAAHEPMGGAEVIIVDDASETPIKPEAALRNGMPVTVIRRDRWEGASARNAGARLARGAWIVMLDDDSHPVDEAVVQVLAGADEDVAAIGAEIVLPDGRHEAGGLPEVFVGCGVALRRQAFLEVGGYDRSFHYYAEEYDLCARLLLAGWRITHDWRWTVRHERDPHGRDMNLILQRLVRNNGYVIQRYAPEAEREAALERVIRRYRDIARRENAIVGCERGLDDLNATAAAQRRRPMSAALWDRFIGLTSVRTDLPGAASLRDRRVTIVDAGKHAWVVRRALTDLGAACVDDEGEAEMQIIGTLSPGPMMDAWAQRVREGRAVVAPWRIPGADVTADASDAYDALCDSGDLQR
ncbi:MAG: glycosyltransferase [Planctomycetota bacterium]|nr:glycosyltransferase [Planctomycetota bacterium]